jgi:hypothetical protein
VIVWTDRDVAAVHAAGHRGDRHVRVLVLLLGPGPVITTAQSGIVETHLAQPDVLMADLPS